MPMKQRLCVATHTKYTKVGVSVVALLSVDMMDVKKFTLGRKSTILTLITPAMSNNVTAHWVVKGSFR
jgi:hypothetical protein